MTAGISVCQLKIKEDVIKISGKSLKPFDTGVIEGHFIVTVGYQDYLTIITIPC